MKFTKKPVEVDAWQWDCSEEKLVLIQGAAGPRTVSVNDDGTLSIETLEGVMKANVNDWVIRGVKGEIYPCKPDIFEATYTEVVKTPFDL